MRPQATTDIPSWSNTVCAKRRFNFLESPGVHAEPYDPSSPLALLKTFTTDKLAANIVNFTSNYADIIINDPAIQARVARKHRSVFHLWRNSNKDEMWLYFGAFLIMGVVQKPEYHMYWTRQHTFAMPIFSQLIRRDRFKQLRKMVHFSYPENEDPMVSPRKLRFFLEYLTACYKENYIPEEHLAIDKYLSLWKGRLIFHMHIPTQQERYSIKIFMLCENKMGYLLNFIIYTGATTEYPDQPDPLPMKFDE